MKKLGKNHATKARHKSKRVHFDKTEKNLTSRAGLIPVIRFLDKHGFSQTFRDNVDDERKPNAIYKLEDAVFFVLIGMIGGAFSLCKCATLWSGCSVLKKVAGWLSTPDETTLGRIFKHTKEKHIGQLETFIHAMRKKIWHQAENIMGANSDIWIDVDSTVKTVYGKQEGAEKGYNPHKKGALSYHPLLAFCATTKEILQGWLRSGSAYTSNGIVQFMQQLLAQMDAAKRIVFRGDSGFFVGELMDYLDSLGHGYLIKVKLKGLSNVLSKQKWAPIPGKPGWEQCSFWYHAKGWNVCRQLVAVRQEISKEESLMVPLFDLTHYAFFCYTTSESLSPWEAHTQYGQRATSETWIEEAKSQLGLGHIKTSDFLANAALFQTAILGYNTLRWMALISANKQLLAWEPTSIRFHMIAVAGKLKTGANQLRIALPENHLYPEPWDDWLKLAA